MTDIVDISTRRHKPPSSPSLQDLIDSLDAQKELLVEALASSQRHLDVTVGRDTIKFTPTKVAVVMGNGETVLVSGLTGFNAIEALGLKQKLNEIILGE